MGKLSSTTPKTLTNLLKIRSFISGGLTHMKWSSLWTGLSKARSILISISSLWKRLLNCIRRKSKICRKSRWSFSMFIVLSLLLLIERCGVVIGLKVRIREFMDWCWEFRDLTTSWIFFTICWRTCLKRSHTVSKL